MSESKVYKIIWRSAIDSDSSTLREDEFVGMTSAKKFIEGLERSRHRTLVRCLPKIDDD